MRVLPIDSVEGCLPCILGLSVIRGQACPVLDLAKLLGIEAEPPTRLVVLTVPDQPKRQVALAVSGVRGVARTHLSELHKLPPLLSLTSADVIEAVSINDAKALMILKTASLIPEEAWTALEAG